MFLSSWADLLRTLVVGPMAYVALLFFLRTSGKRSLSKLNAFDLVITVSLGSALATVLMSKDISLADGILAIGLLLLLQYVVAWSQLRFRFVRRLVKSEPRLLVHDGRLLEDALREERVVLEEIYQVMRTAGFASVAEIGAVVLETDGTFSVIGSSAEQGRSSLASLPGVDRAGKVRDLQASRDISGVQGDRRDGERSDEDESGGSRG